MAGRREDAVVRALLDRYGRSYAEEAGIRLRDTPEPLYQLLGSHRGGGCVAVRSERKERR